MAYNDNAKKPFSNVTITGTGRLGEDPRKVSRDGVTPMVVMRVACQMRDIDRDGEVIERPEWYNLKIFGFRAEACLDNLHKGDEITFTGRAFPSDYVNRDGDEVEDIQITVDRIGKSIFPDRDEDFGGSRSEDDDDDLEDKPKKRSRGSSRRRGGSSRGSSRSRRSEASDGIDDDELYEDNLM